MLAEIRDENFTPSGLRAHAESCELHMVAWQTYADKVALNDEERRTAEDMLYDVQIFRAVFLGLADRMEKQDVSDLRDTPVPAPVGRE